MTRYWRRRSRLGDTVASAAVSLAVGAAAAATTFYVVRLFLAREPLGQPRLPAGTAPGGQGGGRSLPAGADGPRRAGGTDGPA
jgi:hypothetical protein